MLYPENPRLMTSARLWYRSAINAPHPQSVAENDIWVIESPKRMILALFESAAMVRLTQKEEGGGGERGGKGEEGRGISDDR